MFMISRREVLQGAGNALAASMMSFAGALKAEGWNAHSPLQNTALTPTQSRWIEIAESLKPELKETTLSPISIVRAEADPSQYLRWRMIPISPAAELESRTFKLGEQFILDFGAHCTGYFSFSIRGVGRNVDAPARLRFTFGEVPGDVAEPLHPYKGTLSESWLPEDIVNIDYLPQDVRLPRRYAFRYVKVEVIATSPSYVAQFFNAHAHAVTSADVALVTPPPGVSELLQKIDAVSLATLRDCMQTTFEDGPRRDQRLWIGDMRLQALANYKTFGNTKLVKRCLYLFAAFPREDGLLRACVFEKPTPHASGDFIFDYAALYVAALQDYVEHSNDIACGRELWPVARRQMEIIGSHLDADGILIAPQNIWTFIDWEQKLDRSASIHGVALYCYRKAILLADRLGYREDAARYRQTVERMAAAAQGHFFDPAQRLYISGPARQVSLASQAWLILAGVPDSPTGAAALQAALSHPDVVMPATPYLYHHVVEAMFTCGMKQQAVGLIEKYWGGMVRAGADTFWEVYSPTDSLASPYGDVHINSFCHAWSCTPAYLLRNSQA
jgi:hypothetical protein